MNDCHFVLMSLGQVIPINPLIKRNFEAKTELLKFQTKFSFHTVLQKFLRIKIDLPAFCKIAW